jgi:hypothetical protein
VISAVTIAATLMPPSLPPSLPPTFSPTIDPAARDEPPQPPKYGEIQLIGATTAQLHRLSIGAKLSVGNSP